VSVYEQNLAAAKRASRRLDEHGRRLERFSNQPTRADWIAIVFGLGFVLSFGYWTTNFAEVQRALAAKNLSAARRTP
jgi:uncharacterized sodium:solute symporter family permease YidK